MLIVAAALFVLLIANVIFQVTMGPQPQLSAYDDDWNDLSMFLRDMDNATYLETTNIISSPLMLQELDDPTDHVYVAIGVEKQYTLYEAIAIYEFIEMGGTAIIADDFGYANSISDYYDVTYQDGRLYDEQFQVNPKFVVATATTDFGFSGSLVFNEPTGMTIASGHPIVESTSRAWVDTNDNQERDVIDPSSPTGVVEMFDTYTLVVETNRDFMSEENGNVIFISDPSLFIDAMYLKGDNRAFIRALVDYLLPNGGKLIFDESRHTPENIGEGFQQEGFFILVTGTSDLIVKIIVGGLLIPFVLIMVLAIGDPSILIHKQVLSDVSLHNLKTWAFTKRDIEELRVHFLEKVRRTYGMSTDEFSRLSTKELAALVQDKRIMRFLTQKGRETSKIEMDEILVLMDMWGGE